MDLLPLATLVVGLFMGLAIGAARAFTLSNRQRAVAGMNARMGRFWPETLPARSASDILAGRITVVLGNELFELPVLPRGASRRWLQSLDMRFAILANDLETAGDDTPMILNRLLSETDGMYEMLRSYDQTDVLPPRERIDEFVTDVEILRAVLEVWRAANPLAATLTGTTGSETTGTSPDLPSSPPQPTDGDLTTSMVP